jgi:hypothetical protein
MEILSLCTVNENQILKQNLPDAILGETKMKQIYKYLYPCPENMNSRIVGS